MIRDTAPLAFAAVLAACASGSGGGGSGGVTVSTGGTAHGGVAAEGGTVALGGTATRGGTSSGGASATAGSMTSEAGGSLSGGTLGAGGSVGGRASGGGAPSLAGGTIGTGGAGDGSNGGITNAGSRNGGTTSMGGSNAGGGSSGVLRIMALGDSITASTCWRAMLWTTLNTNHAGHFDFVGTLQSDSGCSPSNYDKDNQGYGSSLVTEAVANDTDNRTCQPKCPSLDADLVPAFMSQKPDVVLLHYGTNDVWNGKATADITNAYGKLVDALRAANPVVKLLVAKIIPMHVTGTTCSNCSCSACATAVPALNSAIETWASGKSTAASPITVVDQYTGFDADADTSDGVHPKDAGAQKMAAKWATALEPLF